jgi:hypothetical protein
MSDGFRQNGADRRFAALAVWLLAACGSEDGTSPPADAGADIRTDAAGDVAEIGPDGGCSNEDRDFACDAVDECLRDDFSRDIDGDDICRNIDVCIGDDASGHSDDDLICDDSDLCIGNDGLADLDEDGV